MYDLCMHPCSKGVVRNFFFFCYFLFSNVSKIFSSNPRRRKRIDLPPRKFILCLPLIIESPYGYPDWSRQLLKAMTNWIDANSHVHYYLFLYTILGLHCLSFVVFISLIFVEYSFVLFTTKRWRKTQGQTYTLYHAIFLE